MRRLLAFVLSLCLASQVAAAPVITSVSGDASTDGTLHVSGNGLPAKANSKMFFFADAQGGTLAGNSAVSRTTTLSTSNATVISDSNRRWGSYAFRSNWNYTSSQRAFVLRPSSLSLTYGSRFFISWWEKSDINYTTSDSDTVNGVVHIPGTTQNWKDGYRMWANTEGSQNTNHYVLSVSYNQTANNIRFNQEFPTRSDTLGSAYGFAGSAWRRITVLIEYNSSNSASDGEWHIYKGPTLLESNTSWQFIDATSTGIPTRVNFQAVIANKNVPSGTNKWKSDLALDDSWGRYEICNSATYTSATQCELVPYTSASATSATLYVRNVPSGNKWLFAFDNDNVLSGAYSLSGLSSDPPPTVNAITPTGGPDFTQVTATGANFVATPSVKVCGVDATGETFDSSTQIRFTVPAGTAGQACGVEVINPDGQSVTFNSFAYDPAITTTAGGVLPWIVR